MEILIRPTAAHVAHFAARLVIERVRDNPQLVLGLATGRTMEALYAQLVSAHARGLVDFSHARFFSLDEYVGLASDHPNSYHHYLRQHLFDRVGVTRAQYRLLDGAARDLPAEAAQYEAAIAAAGGIDLQLLGIGASGHIGFNEPLSALMSRTREKALTPLTREQNAGMFGGDPARVPARALTMGVGTILEAREILLLATGSAKAEILAKATEGPITAAISATALQLHRRCKVVVDEDAAHKLTGTAHYRFLFENEPEWAGFREDPAC